VANQVSANPRKFSPPKSLYSNFCESFLLGNKPAIQYLVEITEERSQISLDRNNLANSTLKSGMVEVVEGSNKYGM